MVAIDGRSGSGKSSLAAAIASRTGSQVVHVEDYYPGWRGLAAGAAYLASEVLQTLRSGVSVRARRWDWHRDRFVEGTLVEPTGLIVVEGCGAISRASAPLLDLALWLEADEGIRRRRAVGRDGSDSWWEGWRADEDAFYRREHSELLADRVLGVDVGVDEVLSLLPGSAHSGRGHEGPALEGPGPA